jgi:hypothetical protein
VRAIPVTCLPRFHLSLCSAAADQVQYGAEHYQIQKSDLSTIVNELFKEYRQEGLAMPYTIEDYKHDVTREYFDKLTPEELQQVAEKLLEQLPLEQIEAYLQRVRRTSSASGKKKSKPKK